MFIEYENVYFRIDINKKKLLDLKKSDYISKIYTETFVDISVIKKDFFFMNGFLYCQNIFVSEIS